MYNKKYILKKIEEFNGHNPIYDGVEGKIAYPAYFNVGDRGWFLWIEDCFYSWYREHAHRIHTSIIESIEYIDNQIIVKTQNTRFVFEVISE